MKKIEVINAQSKNPWITIQGAKWIDVCNKKGEVTGKGLILNFEIPETIEEAAETFGVSAKQVETAIFRYISADSQMSVTLRNSKRPHEVLKTIFCGAANPQTEVSKHVVMAVETAIEFIEPSQYEAYCVGKADKLGVSVTQLQAVFTRLTGYEFKPAAMTCLPELQATLTNLHAYQKGGKKC